MKQVYVIQFPKQGLRGYVAAYSSKEDAERFASENELEEHVILEVPDFAKEKVLPGRGDLAELRFASREGEIEGLYPNDNVGICYTLKLDPWLVETRMGLRLFVRSRTSGPMSLVLECRQAYTKLGKHHLLLMPVSNGTNLGMASDGLNELVFARTKEEAVTSSHLVRF